MSAPEINAVGPEIVREIKKRGHKIFLDLKLHDIPNTVKKSMRVLSKLDVDMCNLHASGTIAMMEAAIEGLTREDGTRPLLIAVTQLTSTSEERMKKDLLIDAPMDETVLHYAHNAKLAGLDGVVCSPLEAGKVHERCGSEFYTVTPGVRFADGDIGDQQRVHWLDGLIDVEEGDFIEGTIDGDAPRASGNGDQSGISQLRQYVSDNDGIGIDAPRKELAGHLVFIFKNVNTGEDVQRYCKPA